MKINITKLDKDQLIELLRKLNIIMAGGNQSGYKYDQTHRKYLFLMEELKRRRKITSNLAPEVIRRDTNSNFGEINHKYYQTLSPIDQGIYINWKWVEL